MKDEIFIYFLVECVFLVEHRCERPRMQVKRQEKMLYEKKLKKNTNDKKINKNFIFQFFTFFSLALLFWYTYTCILWFIFFFFFFIFFLFFLTCNFFCGLFTCNPCLFHLQFKKQMHLTKKINKNFIFQFFFLFSFASHFPYVYTLYTAFF